MKKAIDLRTQLLASVPFLTADPAKLTTLIERGACVARLGSLDFEYRYTLTLTVLDYGDHADTLMIPLLAWVSVNQPDLLQNPDKQEKAIRFEVEIIDHAKADIEIAIDLTEAVGVVEADGIYTATHHQEPALPDLGGPRGWELNIRGIEVL